MIPLAAAFIVVMALLGAPLFAVVLAGAMLGFLAADVDLAVVAIELYRITDTPLLVALPFFTFAGYLMAEANTPRRLMDLTRALFGWMPAGVAIVGFVACAVFTALTGASGVTIVALGALLLPMLKESGYSERYSLGARHHVREPGAAHRAVRAAHPLRHRRPADERGRAVHHPGAVPRRTRPGAPDDRAPLGLDRLAPRRRGAHPLRRPRGVGRAQGRRWELPLPVFVLGGIYSGLFAISEAAAMTALYVIAAEVFGYREVAVRDLPRIMRESMVMVGSIILILGAALAFTNYLIDAGAPQALFEFMQARVTSPLTFLILLNVLLLVLGAVLDVFSAVVIMTPLLLPVAAGYGVHPIHLGVIFLANLQIGYFTPPIGMNLFIASYRFDRPLLDLYAACLPFMAVLLLALLIITYVPALSLWFL